jgi:hypothetical protein
MYQRVNMIAGCHIASIVVWIHRMTRGQMGSELTKSDGLMTVGLDAFGCLDETLDFVLSKSALLNIAEQVHDLGMVM